MRRKSILLAIIIIMQFLTGCKDADEITNIAIVMIWPSTNQSNKTIKAALLATITSGLLITSFDILAVSVLGEGIFKNSIYPLHTLVKQIIVGNFIENLDAIEVLYFLTTSFVKISIYFLSVVMAFKKLTVVKNYRIFIFPVIIIVLYLSMTMSTSVTSHIESAGEVNPNILMITFNLILPIILLITTIIKKLRMKKSD